ncbi:N4-gp56 family major capsid protein [Roseateles chitinivorans]|uniref:N4-gp56 family major capsid protein n=1 Tax=Roseateles chitinivorans TaxID=2917965 RepID=A0A2G9C6X4_9BURK|nr:N4-gp56 family major capsid protein [Roseateles chitinivorans]PIM52092.1 N4-gp56 family major capsid protein [Roseateles chitinivorans]
MARTIVGVNDPKAVKRFGGMLALDTSQSSYWNQRFMARGAEAEVPIQILTDLESDAGEQITYDLLAELRMAPVEGEDTLEGKEEAQKFYTDQIYIDQARCGVNTGGRMTRKRTLHNLREKAKRQQSNWWARLQDELLFIYLSGNRGINPNFLLPLNYAGRANNALFAPDANHQLFGNDATAFNNIDANDKFDLRLVDRAKTRADSQGGGATGIPVLQPCKIDGNETFVCVMHTFQEDDLRANTSTGQWMDIQKAAASAEGRNSPLFKGSLGMYRGCILHSHRNVIRFNNAGAGGNVEAARALFLGSQAAVVAFGSPGTNMRFTWNEETRDNGDKVVITTSSIFGVKKVRFTVDGQGDQDFGVFALDTAAANR